jgi:hypothetical protein
MNCTKDTGFAMSQGDLRELPAAQQPLRKSAEVYLAAFALSLGLIAATAHVAAADVLILRSGTERQGRLQSCSGQACLLDQSRIPRDAIEWIGLTGRPPPPAVRNPTVDEAHTRGGAITPGKLVQIDERVVTMDGETLARSEVSWIHLGRIATRPAIGKWQGTLTGHGEGGPNNETAAVSFNFSEKDDGAIEGSGHVTVTSKKFRFPQYCEGQAMPLDPFDVSIGGRRVGDEFQLELGNPMLSGTSSGICRYPNKTSSWTSPWQASFSSPQFGDIGRPKVAARYGATNSFTRKFGYINADAMIELHQAKQ